MANPKALRLFILLFITLVIFTKSATAEICLCGEACPHFFANTLKQTKKLPLHSHCAGTNCKSCTFEDGQILKARNISSKVSDIKSLYTHIFLFALSAYILKNRPVKGVIYCLYSGEKIHFTPIYLQNQSFLC